MASDIYNELEELPFSSLDNDSFELEMYQLSHGRVNFEADRLLNLKLNPLHCNQQYTSTLTSNLDPDSNFLNDLNCDFYTESSVNSMLRRNNQSQSDPCLSFMHLNIRSLGRNLSQLQNLLATINNKFSVIAISETWLQDLTHHVDTDGYSFVHNYRCDKTGGGVGLYIACEFEYRIRDDLRFNDKKLAESLFVEIDNPKGKNYIAGVIYRPPSQNVADFIANLNILIGKISKENKYCYIMGDFNLNLLNEQLHQLTSEFLDIMYANMLFPTITLPTRITWHSATLIDNIFTNDLNNYTFSGLLLSDISDHLPIFSIFNKKFEGKDEASYFLYRDKSSKNVTEFRNCLSQINWFDLDDISDPVKAYSSFFN